MPLPPVNAAGGSPRPATLSAISPAPLRFAQRPLVRVRRSAMRTAVPAVVLAALLALSWSVVPGGFPAPVVNAAGCPSSLQALINSTPTGATLNVPACVFHESVSIGRAMTIKAAAGATVDGDNTRTTGVMVQADDVTIDGLTVQRIHNGDHVGAVNLYYGARFTFENGVVRDSSTVCLAMHAATGARVLDSELAGCGQEGFFLNAMTNTLLARNRIHGNNAALAFDWGSEAGGGKAMASDGVTFDGNEVADNRGPGIWFDNGATNATITNNRVHDNDREGIFFEISRGARIAGNAVWNNGFGFAAWGYGAGILVSSSDGATVTGNTVAWSARGISVISQARDYSPHDHDTVTDNVIVGAGSAPLAGFYDDHGGTLFASGNANGGSGNRYWAGVPEPSSDRFNWNGSRTTLAAYDATPGEEAATYLTLADRDSLLAAAGIPTSPGGTPSAPAPAAGDPRVVVSGSNLPTTGLHATLTWSRIGIALAYQLQLQRDGGTWSSVALASSLSRSATVALAPGHAYRARLRLKAPPGTWSAWSTTATFTPMRYEETSGRIAYAGGWSRSTSTGASQGHVRFTARSGASATVRFTGRAIAWVAPVGPVRGSARVYVDGRQLATVSLYRTAWDVRRIVFRTSWASSGTHTLRIVVVGTARHPRVDVDAFAVIR